MIATLTAANEDSNKDSSNKRDNCYNKVVMMIIKYKINDNEIGKCDDNSNDYRDIRSQKDITIVIIKNDNSYKKVIKMIIN